MTADAIVVGAGPAGSMAALVLARAGVRVRVVDRQGFPRDKLCGDTVNPGALALLDGAGLGPVVRARGVALGGMIVTAPGARVAASYPPGYAGVAIRRRDLDDLILRSAIDAGAEFEPAVRATAPVLSPGGGRVSGVRVRTAVGESAMTCRIVVIADGRGSRLASALRLSRFARTPRRWAYGAYFEGVREVTSVGEMHIRPPGYIGVAPLPGGLTNVCVVRERTRVDARRPVAAADIVAHAVMADDVLRDRFGGARQVSTVRALGPLAVDARLCGCPGALVAGDAAGFVDPVTGDGLRFALRGGELAAQAALQELATGAPAFRDLRSLREREFRGKWRLNRALRTMVGSPRAVQAAACIARVWRAPVEHLVALAGDVGVAAAHRDRVQESSSGASGFRRTGDRPG
jgi:flavin-dependent dehydrogenase